MKRGEITIKILGKLEEAVLGISDLFSALLKSGYGASYGKIEIQKSRQKASRDYNTSDIKLKQNYWRLIYKLKREGLIKEEGGSNRRFLKITRIGKQKLSNLQSIENLPTPYYVKKPNNNLIIIVFDIPENIKRKRVWLRSVLKNLDFEMVQKSVWMGKIKIPKCFLDDLNKMRLINFVEIFEISKFGTLRNIN